MAQTGRSSPRPCSSDGFPFASKTCHTAVPPFAQPVPSLQATSVSPLLFVIAIGCRRFVVPVGELIFPIDIDFASTGAKKICPAVSHAATAPPPFAGPKNALLIGQPST